ncbi:MAG: hypothetical protein EB127_13030 [Alphaproteobacteria bacterium]|nr:hypothetical protein [Alphaproteobacteria bacterium]
MFLRHIGRHGDRKVAIIFREVPGEPHMCLVTYPEVLNQHIHDPLMKCIESDIGQNSEDLALALNRTYTKDGAIILQKLHAEGMLKKIRTELVVMTPQPGVQIKLDELNKILDEMKQGEEAVKKLAEMDSSMGLQDPADVARRLRGDKNKAPVAATGDALGDQAIASNLRQQAEKMDREAKGLLAEAARLLKEAASLDPVKASKETAPKAKKAKSKVTA